jgi:uncharacterized membrane-anchored protein YitT (DUF2179 family)
LGFFHIFLIFSLFNLPFFILSWKIWKKGKLKCEKIWTIWKKGKLNSEKI